jgi:ribosomal protein L11 methyltransferase
VPWQQLILQVDAADLPKAEALLKLAGAEALSLQGGGEDEILEPAPGTTPLWRRVALRALFDAAVDTKAVSGVLQSALASEARVTTEPLREEDWARATHGTFEARRIGRLLLVPADRGHREPAGILVRLHMGLAFGTGRHPTTRLCLEWLEARLTPGARVLDYGAGSGVLALAALALGAEHAWAVDIDPQALTATRENAVINSAEDALWAGTPQGFEATPAAEGRIDVVVANILAGPLEALAGSFARYLRPGGSIVLSGLLEAQCEAVEAAYAAHFRDFEHAALDGWARISATSSPSRAAAPCA